MYLWAVTVFCDSTCNSSILQSLRFWVMKTPVRVLVYFKSCRLQPLWIWDVLIITKQTCRFPIGYNISVIQNYNSCKQLIKLREVHAMFYCRHFNSVRIESHSRHPSIKFLTTQTDQSKRDILIHYVLKCFWRLHWNSQIITNIETGV